MKHIKTYFFDRFNTFSVLLLSSIAAILLLMIRVKLTHTFFLLFMVWNLFLAFIPFCITAFLKYRPKQLNKWKLLFWSGVWMLFLPNAPYMITDMIHLISKESILWLDTILILSFALNGLILYYISVGDMKKILRHHVPPFWLRCFFAILPVIIAVGVYVGRFLRWNSWDIITSPLGPIRDVISLIRYPLHHSLEWGFIISFSLILYMGNLAVNRLAFLNKLN